MPRHRVLLHRERRQALRREHAPGQQRIGGGKRPTLRDHRRQRGHADPALWLRSLPEHPPALPGAGRRVRRPDGDPVLVEVPPPNDEALQAAPHKISARWMKLLTRRGMLVEETGSTDLADSETDSDDACELRPLQAAACTCRIAFGPRAWQKIFGQRIFTVQGGMPRHAAVTQTLCVGSASMARWRPTPGLGRWWCRRCRVKA